MYPKMASSDSAIAWSVENYFGKYFTTSGYDRSNLQDRLSTLRTEPAVGGDKYVAQIELLSAFASAPLTLWDIPNIVVFFVDTVGITRELECSKESHN